jgi:hypothetical protein
MTNLVISMAGKKKVLEHRSGLHPSEKELLERCSGTKIPLVLKNIHEWM